MAMPELAQEAQKGRATIRVTTLQHSNDAIFCLEQFPDMASAV